MKIDGSTYMIIGSHLVVDLVMLKMVEKKNVHCISQTKPYKCLQCITITLYNVTFPHHFCILIKGWSNRDHHALARGQPEGPEQRPNMSSPTKYLL